MMKIPARLLLIMVLLFVAISKTQARPWWQAMDIETANPPARYGYHVSRTLAEDKDHYVITVDPAAAAVLTGARIGWVGTNKEFHKVEITKVGGQTKIEFTVPPEYLQPSSYLRFDSGPIKYCGAENMDNFHGYQLRLDNIPRDSGRDFGFIPNVRIVDGGFEFSYNLIDPPSISGPPPESKRRVLSITLESTTQGQLSVPMRLDNLGAQGQSKFFLSSDQVGDFMLSVNITSHADLFGSKGKKHYVGLGILAANAELAAEENAELKGFPFHEPKYPEGVDTNLLHELAWFFGGEGDFKKEKTAENWEDLLMRMKKAGLPRLAKKTDLKVTKEEIANLADEAVLVVLGHQHPVNFSLHIGQIRTHWLPAKGTMKNESGYAGMDLFWSYPYDAVPGKSSGPPEFIKPTK